MNDEICWIDRNGQEIPMSQMDDRYLYNTVKCIWNNRIGYHAPFGDVIGWRFSPHSHPEFFLQLFFDKGIEELKKRKVELAQKFLDWVEKTNTLEAKRIRRHLHDFFEWDDHFNELEFGDFGDK